MPRYFLNIRNSSGFAEDEEGQELADLQAARAEAIAGIRSVLAEEIKRGVLDLRGQVEITDEAAALLAVVPYREALELQMEVEPA
jgi:hypothetical protein